MKKIISEIRWKLVIAKMIQRVSQFFYDVGPGLLVACIPAVFIGFFYAAINVNTYSIALWPALVAFFKWSFIGVVVEYIIWEIYQTIKRLIKWSQEYIDSQE